MNIQKKKKKIIDDVLEINYQSCCILSGPPCIYAVKAQTSLAPLSRFRGSHITTAHEQQCCRFQSYAKAVPSPMKLIKREPHSWDPRQRTT